ncbi:Sardh, partial [Symbiodinium pilosum]
HTIGKSIAYGYVDCPESEKKITNKWLEAGDWHIGDKGERHAAKLHLKAPFDPTNSRVKGLYETSSEPTMAGYEKPRTATVSMHA